MNQRQSAFLCEYLKSGNATQAAITAGYSAKTAYSQGQRLLKNVEVLAAIEDAREKVCNVAILTREQSLEVLTGIALTAKQDYARIRAIEAISKMQGWESAQKHEIGFTEISIKKITPDMTGECDCPLEEVT